MKIITIGIKSTIKISLPRFSSSPHLTSSLAPKACEVKVSCAQLVPIKIEVPKMLRKVMESPTPAIISEVPVYPMKYKFIKLTSSTNKF